MTTVIIRMPDGQWADIGGPDHVWALDDETRIDTEDPTGHSQLFVTLEPDTTYVMDLWLHVYSEITAGIDIRISWLWDFTELGPIGDVQRYCTGPAPGSTDPDNTQSIYLRSGSDTQQVVYGVTANPGSIVHEHLLVRTVANGGVWRLAWAQGTATAHNLHIVQGSHLRLEKASAPYQSIGIS